MIACVCMCVLVFACDSMCSFVAGRVCLLLSLFAECCRLFCVSCLCVFVVVVVVVCFLFLYVCACVCLCVFVLMCDCECLCLVFVVFAVRVNGLCVVCVCAILCAHVCLLLLCCCCVVFSLCVSLFVLFGLFRLLFCLSMFVCL